MNKKNVIIITDFYHSQQNTTGYMLEKVYKSLENSDDFNAKLITRFEQGIPNFPNTIFIKAPKLDKKNLLKRVVYDSVVTFKFTSKILKNIKKQDIVFTTTTPVFLIVSVAFLKKIIGFKWILLVHDIFPENLVVTKTINEDSLFYRLLTQLFNHVYQSADNLIVIGSDMQHLMINKTKKSNVTIVQNWIDEADIKLESKKENKILNKLGWNNDTHVIFQFFGNIGRVQGLDVLLESIKKVKNLDAAKFLFIGDGAYVEELKLQIEDINHPNVIYYGKVSPEEKSSGLSACDIAFVTLAEGMKGLGVPSKTYYSMAANKYIFAIMDNDTEVANMVNQHNIGWTCSSNDSDVIANKIDAVIKNWENLKFNVQPREILKKYYSESIAMEKILQIIKSIN
ncbi:glycosyltransferase family 4 protein [Moraxella osloensis]|nr:glycosyltransferase family 4 protein [Moraxella osloensis]